MSDAPQPPPGWQPPPPPTSPPPPPTAPGGYAPPPGSTPPPPPGTAGYGYGVAQQGGGQPRALGGVSTALWILLAINVPIALLNAIARFGRSSLIDEGDFTFDEANDADALVATAFLLSLLLGLATIVLWLIWQFRHAKNAEVLGKREGLGAGWAIGGWFIPIANIVLGPLQLLQSSKWSDPDAPGRAGRTPPLVVVWWVLLVLTGLSSLRFNAGASDVDGSFDLEEIRDADQATGFASILGILLAVVAVLMVRELTRRQRQAMAARGMTV